MEGLPNGINAIVDPRKLSDYVLDPNHRTGRHKARVFASALGLTAADAGDLANALAQAAATENAEFSRNDIYGAHYTVEFTMTFKGRAARIKSLWIIRAHEDVPRLITAFVARQDQEDA